MYQTAHIGPDELVVYVLEVFIDADLGLEIQIHSLFRQHRLFFVDNTINTGYNIALKAKDVSHFLLSHFLLKYKSFIYDLN